LVRISYYWLDYVVGYNLLVRKDVQYDKFSVFDRYSYDLLVDPKRTRLNLPLGIRKLFVKCMPHPKVVFYLNATPDVIYKRKQELTLQEIKRQNILYKKVAASHKRFTTLDSNRPVNESVDDAIKIILETFTKKL
jgi:thymidylate kinase